MDFWNCTTTREACIRNVVFEAADKFYKMAFADAVRVNSAQFCGQLQVERTGENARKPYYAVWPSVVPMLTRLNLDLDSSLIQLPLLALCIRFPKEKNPLPDYSSRELPLTLGPFGSVLLAERREPPGFPTVIPDGSRRAATE